MAHTEVLLVKPVEGLGGEGDQVKVRAGYASNFLLPRNLALAVTEHNKRQIERERKVAEARELEEQSQAEAYAQRLSQVEVEIPLRVGEHNALFGSVTTSDVAQALAARGFELEKRKIQLAEPLKAIGETMVTIKVYRDVTAQVRVKVIAEKS